MICLIGNISFSYSYSYSYPYPYPYPCPYPPHHRVRERVPLRCVRFWAELEVVRKAFRIRKGRFPAEIAEGAEVYWEGANGANIGVVFHNCLGLLQRYNCPPPKKMSAAEHGAYPLRLIGRKRLCASARGPSGWGWGDQVGNAATFRTTSLHCPPGRRSSNGSSDRNSCCSVSSSPAGIRGGVISGGSN